jgi:hypothetical protein
MRGFLMDRGHASARDNRARLIRDYAFKCNVIQIVNLMARNFRVRKQGEPHADSEYDEFHIDLIGDGRWLVWPGAARRLAGSTRRMIDQSDLRDKQGWDKLTILSIHLITYQDEIRKVEVRDEG